MDRIQEIVRLFKENVIEPEKQDVVIIHGDDEESANYVKDLLLQDNFVCHDVHIICIGPAVGITMGPNMGDISVSANKLNLYPSEKPVLMIQNDSLQLRNP